MKSNRERWAEKYDFYKIAHEHLFIFRKTYGGQEYKKIQGKHEVVVISSLEQ